MKSKLKSLIIRLKPHPLLGKPVRFAIAIYRVPRLLSAYTDQLPALLETVSKLNHHQHEIDRDQDNLVRSVPAALRTLRRDLNLLGALQQQQYTDIRTKLDLLSERMLDMRRGLVSESRYGARDEGAGASATLQTKIIASQKVAAAHSGMLRLNLGSGNVPLEGYLNVDRRELPGVDVVADVGKLPFERGEVDEIFSAHLLEDFPQEKLRKLLPYWKSLLKPGGLFRAVVSDAEAMIREYSAGRFSYEVMREVLYGAQATDRDFHYNAFTPGYLSALLGTAGFFNVEVVAAGRRNGLGFESEVKGMNGKSEQKADRSA